MPSTPLICSSIGVATVSAITFGLAPGYCARTTTDGGTTSGYSEIGSTAQREQAGEEDQHRQDAGEDRPVDEEVGEVHGSAFSEVVQALAPSALARAFASDAGGSAGSLQLGARVVHRATVLAAATSAPGPHALQAVDDDALAAPRDRSVTMRRPSTDGAERDLAIVGLVLAHRRPARTSCSGRCRWRAR